MVSKMSKWLAKVAIVTGASSGIGAAIARRLALEGLTVVGLARRVGKIQSLSESLSGKGSLYAQQADCSREEDILEAFDWTTKNLGAVHVLVNNAAVFKLTSFTEGQTEDWRSMYDLNVLGLSIATREACKDMIKNRTNGHIFNINSTSGHYCNWTGMNVYSVSKHGVTALTELTRQELAKKGHKIKITSISPGLVATDMTTGNKEVPDHLAQKIRKKPCLQSEDIADCVVYALSTPEHVQIHEIMVRPFGEFP